jgi:hypothetical protein
MNYSIGMVKVELAGFFGNVYCEQTQKNLKCGRNAQKCANENEAILRAIGYRPPCRILLLRRNAASLGVAGAEIENGKTLRRESYVLPEEVKAVLEIKKENNMDYLIFHIDPKENVVSKIRYPAVRIEAIVGKDRRFEREAKK